MALRPSLLIVDDEEGPRQSLRIVFKDDYDVFLADSAEAALNLVRGRTVDAAVVDIRMAGTSGTELLARLKEHDPTIEVIMLTAYETVETARQSLRLGACDYLTKPFDIAAMRSAVANAIQRHSLTREVHANNQKLMELQEEIRAFQQQKEQIKTKGEIYASIVHDINGPLTIISGFMEIIVRKISSANRLEGEDLDAIKDRLAKITRQVTNCIEMSQRYLSFLRKHQTEASYLDVNQVFQSLDEFLKVHPSAKNNLVVLRPLPRNWVADMNSTDLHQVLQNLAINALQATAKPHRVEISGRCLDQPVNASRWVAGPSDYFLNVPNFVDTAPLLALSVTDDGPGIPSELLPKVFAAYFTTKSAGQGTGLGLSIVARLITEANGAVHLHSEVGQGTTFTIYLPARPSASTAAP